MREELEDVVELYGGMPPEGQEHWRARSLPCVTFDSDTERDEFLAALDERDKPLNTAAPATTPAASKVASATTFQRGQRVKANLAGLIAGGVQFSQNCEAVYATIESQISDNPPTYRLHLLISFRGVTQIDATADRIKPM